MNIKYIILFDIFSVQVKLLNFKYNLEKTNFMKIFQLMLLWSY